MFLTQTLRIVIDLNCMKRVMRNVYSLEGYYMKKYIDERGARFNGIDFSRAVLLLVLIRSASKGKLYRLG